MKTIQRGIIYQTIYDNLNDLINAIFTNNNDHNLVGKFEKKFSEYTDKKYCVAFPFARTALYYYLKLLNLPKNSEIIMPPIHIKAFLDIVLHLNLKPIFVDIDLNTLSYDLDDLKNKITSSTKVILVTYLYGIVANIDELLKISKDKNLSLIEDFSHCLNAKLNDKKLGSFGNIGIYSSSSIKTLDTYGGGQLVTDDSKLYLQLKSIQKKLSTKNKFQLSCKILLNLFRNILTNKIFFSIITFRIIIFLSIFNPQLLQRQIGQRKTTPIKSLPSKWFVKYSSVQAKAGLRFIKNIHFNDQKRITNVNHIIQSVNNLKYPIGVKDSQNVYWQFLTYHDNPSKIMSQLRKNKIDSTQTSLLLLSSLKKYNFDINLNNAKYIYAKGVFIPSFSSLKKTDLTYIVNSLTKIIK